MQVRRQQAWLSTVIDSKCAVFPWRLYITNQDVEYVEYRGFGLIMEIFSQVKTISRLMETIAAAAEMEGKPEPTAISSDETDAVTTGVLPQSLRL